MDDVKQSNDHLRAAKYSFVLFIMGLLVPVVILLGLNPQDTVASIFGSSAVGGGFICECLAFVLGIVGWRHTQGKIGMIGSIIVLVLVPLWTVVAGGP